MLYLFSAFLGVLVLLVGCVAPKQAVFTPSVFGEAGGETPLTMASGSLNGKPMTLIVDSGAPTTILALQLVDYYGVEVQEQVGVSGGVGGTTPRYSGWVDAWSVEGASGGRSMIETQTLPFVSSSPSLEGPHGLMGLDLLEELGAILDYSRGSQGGVMLLDPSGDASERLRRVARSSDWTSIPLMRVANEPYHVMPVVVRGQLQHWMVDTGAQRGVVRSENARSLGLPVSASGRRIVGATGSLSTDETEDLVLALEGGHLVQGDFVLLAKEMLGSSPPRSIHYGIIGGNTLNALQAIYDVGAQTVYIPRPPRR